MIYVLNVLTFLDVDGGEVAAEGVVGGDHVGPAVGLGAVEDGEQRVARLRLDLEVRAALHGDAVPRPLDARLRVTHERDLDHAVLALEMDGIVKLGKSELQKKTRLSTIFLVAFKGYK